MPFIFSFVLSPLFFFFPPFFLSCTDFHICKRPCGGGRGMGKNSGRGRGRGRSVGIIGVWVDMVG